MARVARYFRDRTLAWPVVLKFALIMKLGEHGRAADRALPADISLPPVALRSSMIVYLPYCTPPALPHRGSRDDRQRLPFLPIWNRCPYAGLSMPRPS
jgi:hypothetical protein